MKYFYDEEEMVFIPESEMMAIYEVCKENDELNEDDTSYQDFVENRLVINDHNACFYYAEKLNIENKNDVSAKDVIFFSNKEKYLVLSVIHGERNRTTYTLQDIKTKQIIYSYPSSNCYGAFVIKDGYLMIEK